MENYTENVHKEVEELCRLFKVQYDSYFLKRALQEILKKVKASL